MMPLGRMENNDASREAGGQRCLWGGWRTVMPVGRMENNDASGEAGGQRCLWGGWRTACGMSSLFCHMDSRDPSQVITPSSKLL